MPDLVVHDRFRTERSAPFHDLVGLVAPVPGGSVVHLGTGSGRLTAEVHRRTRAARTTGVLASCATDDVPGPRGGVRLVQGDAATWAPDEQVDLVISHGALHMVPAHERLLTRLSSWLAPGGQLALELPANHDHPAHAAIARVAALPEFADALGVQLHGSPVLRPERYMTLLHQLGFEDQHVRTQVYPHHLAGPEDVASWIDGALLCLLQERLSELQHRRFLRRLREELVHVLPDERPYLLTCKRLLVWGRR